VDLRINQGKIREEFLRKESQSRFQQYQQLQDGNSVAHFQNNHPPLPSGIHHSHPSADGYNMEAAQRTATLLGVYGAEGYPGGYSGDAALRTPYPAQTGHYESSGNAHGRGLEPRYPGSRGYSAGSRQH
jgi:hypothetical protein